MYDWEGNRERCYQLYVVENKSIDEVLELMRVRHDFTPSRRSLQAYFRKWNFRARGVPAYKNDELVARVRELWTQNLRQKEILRILTEEDGFDVGKRDLQRLRAKFRLLLRETRDPRKGSQASSQHGEDDESDDYDDREGSDDSEASADGAQADLPAPDLSRLQAYTDTRPDQQAMQAQVREQRMRELAAESDARMATRQRRRRTKGWAGLPADPPGPPRFPSETTLEQARAILQLTDETNKEVREKFKMMCEEEGIIKKTLAGPDKWEAVKERLVMESMHLRAVLYGGEDLDQKKLAIDILACDVTKRMRVAGSRITIAEAKSILGLDPEQGRAVRFALYQMLTENHFMSRVLSGPGHWEDLKQQWVNGSEPLRRAMAAGAADPNFAMKTKALELLGRDVRKRYQEGCRAEKKATPAKKAKTSKKRQASSPSPASDGQNEGFELPELPDSPPPPTPPSVLRQARTRAKPQSRRPQQTPVAPAPTHTPIPTPAPTPASLSRLPEHRLLPAQAMNTTPGLSMGAHLGQSMLMDQDPQTAYLTTHFVPVYVPPQQTPVYAPVTPSEPYAIYLRLAPTSSFPAVTPMWIAMMTTRTLDELRTVAVEKYPGAVCLGVSGIIKDGKGGEMMLEVNEDAQVEAYLGHMQHKGPPTFSVQIRIMHDMNMGVPGQTWG